MNGSTTRILGAAAMLMAGTALATAAAPAQAQAPGEDQRCANLNFANVNWTGVTVKTEVASMLLDALGYETQIRTTSVPIAFQSVADQDSDMFLGLWLPNQQENIQEYYDEGTIEEVQKNLDGAKYTLGVPEYVYEAGVTHYDDLDPNREKFNGRIYGIEAGNAGNQNIKDMINANDYGLGDWELLPSSETGMLSEVGRKVRGDDWVVFLAWTPHAMNERFDIRYLAGGEDYFGPNKGAASVHTIAWNGFPEACPNVGQFLNNYVWTTAMQDEAAYYVSNEDMEYAEAGKAVLESQSDVLGEWLDGVQTTDGEDGLAAVRQTLGMN